MRLHPLIVALAVIASGWHTTAFAADTTGKPVPPMATPAPARVYAAASLTQALTAAAAAWQAKGHPAPVLVFGGSGALAKQLDAGAPADLFAAADASWMDYLEQHQRLLAGSRRNLLGNTLVLVAPAARPFRVEMRSGFPLADQFSGRWCTGEPGAVPVGTYAREALRNLGWWQTLENRMVGTEDVRSALAFVARGECAMGVVYGTDSRSVANVAVLGTFPTTTHSPIVYPFAALRSASVEGLAFLQFLGSNEGLAHFRQAGFSPLPQ